MEQKNNELDISRLKLGLGVGIPLATVIGIINYYLRNKIPEEKNEGRLTKSKSPAPNLEIFKFNNQHTLSHRSR